MKRITRKILQNGNFNSKEFPIVKKMIEEGIGTIKFDQKKMKLQCIFNEVQPNHITRELIVDQYGHRFYNKLNSAIALTKISNSKNV